MPLTLLTLERETFLPLHTAAEQGDEDAARQIEALWADYADGEIECFLCGGVVMVRPIRAVIVPDYNNDSLLAMPLCEPCFDLPKAQRWGRTLRLLKKMWSARSGKNIHFQFNTHVKGRWRR